MVVHVTADELISTLNHSSLPTILVEGKDDAKIYRWIESNIGIGVDVLICDGRSTLLEVYNRKEELKNPKIIYVADRDMWLFTSVPEQYTSIIWTNGYSIENDIYASSRKYLHRLMETNEMTEKKKILESICKWFAYEVENYRNSKDWSIDYHINYILTEDRNDLNPNFMQSRNYHDPSIETYKEIIENYELKLRGKNIFQILLCLLSARDRKSKYSRENLFELCLKFGYEEGSYLKELIENIKLKLAS